MTKLLTRESPLQVLPTLACHLGVNAAIVVQQVHYLRYKQKARMQTASQWRRFFPFWSIFTIRQVMRELTSHKVLSVHAGSYVVHPQSFPKALGVSIDHPLFIQETPRFLLPQLACRFGVSQAIVLQHIYWHATHCSKNGCKTLTQWHKEFPFFSYKTLGRIMEEFQKQGMVRGVRKHRQQYIGESDSIIICLEGNELSAKTSAYHSITQHSRCSKKNNQLAQQSDQFVQQSDQFVQLPY